MALTSVSKPLHVILKELVTVLAGLTKCSCVLPRSVTPSLPEQLSRKAAGHPGSVPLGPTLQPLPHSLRGRVVQEQSASPARRPEKATPGPGQLRGSWWTSELCGGQRAE